MVDYDYTLYYMDKPIFSFNNDIDLYHFLIENNIQFKTEYEEDFTSAFGAIPYYFFPDYYYHICDNSGKLCKVYYYDEE